MKKTIKHIDSFNLLFKAVFCTAWFRKQSLHPEHSLGIGMGIVMNKFLDEIAAEMKQAFAAAGYRAELGKVTVSNRPDLCEYQCNGAMAGAKEYRKPPLQIAAEVADRLADSHIFAAAAATPPGFINLRVKPDFVKAYLEKMAAADKFGLERPAHPQTIMLDYGGANVAKPLHVGHLRSAIIGESIKRMVRYAGHTAIGDIHLGDWGLQMGLIIMELAARQPGLVYFDEDYTGEYPAEAPFGIGELEEIYPAASKKSKEDPLFKEKAMAATLMLQNGRPGYRALWRHIMKVSLTDLRKNYDKLQVEFDLWKGESDVQALIPGMVDELKQGGFAYLSDGALVVDVKEESDAREIPPCMILKSDGASLYNTTDLATIKARMAEYAPDEMIYMTDKRQELYFEQVFRCARKTGLVKAETALRFLGFGTMNGPDGKPFKTRDGGVMRLENLIAEINEEMYKKIVAGREMPAAEAHETAQIVGLAALKYGDLSNQAAKDYIFDIDRFTSFEGDTGPYILYTIVRIKSILAKYAEQGGVVAIGQFRVPDSAAEKELMLMLTGFTAMMETAFTEIAPHKICAFIYELANVFNTFYHETKILTEENAEKKRGILSLLAFTKEMLETCVDLLGFGAPDRM